MIRALFWALMLTLTASAALALTGMQWIARVYPDGTVGFNKLIYTTVEPTEVEISELDGAIYRSSENGMSKLDENGDWVDGWSLPAFANALGFDIDDNGDILWIAGTEKTSDSGLYKYTSGGGYLDGIEDFNPNDAVFDNGFFEVWSTANNVVQVGVHKFTESGSRLFYKPEYLPTYGSAGDVPSGAFWFLNWESGDREVVKLDDEGNEEFRLTDYTFPRDPQTDSISESCWFFEHYDGDVIKVSSSGGEVFRDPSFTDVAAIDVYEADGSVWVAANGKGALVHLSAGGEELLSLPFEAEMLHLAVDQRDGSCVVISDGNGLGDLNIQPSSVGRIKAMFAGEGPTSGAGKDNAPIYEHPWYGYPP